MCGKCHFSDCCPPTSGTRVRASGGGILAKPDFLEIDYMSDYGYVYFVHAYGSNFFKIGKAKNPSARLQQMQTGHHGHLYIYATIKTKDKSFLEKQAQDFFKSYHAKGEWFEIVDHHQSVFADFAKQENHQIFFHNYSHSHQMQCGWHGLRIVSPKILHIFLVKSDCCDMAGCTSLAETILPEVQLIQTFSGETADFRYVKNGKEWSAQIGV